VRALLTSDAPADTHQRRENDGGSGRPPVTHQSSGRKRYAAHGTSIDFARL
jgi:hypothetical protein